MAEEHRCQAPPLCANNCGFFGSPATQNLCSKCYRDLQLKEQQSSSAKQALNQSFISSPSQSSSTSISASTLSVSSPAVDLSLDKKLAMDVKTEENPVVSPSAVVLHQTALNRCLTCRRRVGLTGFKCRCGSVFCGTHRHPEQHDCTFDFKGTGKEEIAKANPLVKAEKLQKI